MTDLRSDIRPLSDIRAHRKLKKVNGQVTFPGRPNQHMMEERLDDWLRNLDPQKLEQKHEQEYLRALVRKRVMY